MSGALLVQLIIGGFGFSGIIGAGIALFKLRPEVNTMAVTDMGEVATRWKELADQRGQELAETELERDTWRDRALQSESDLRKLQGK